MVRSIWSIKPPVLAPSVFCKLCAREGIEKHASYHLTPPHLRPSETSEWGYEWCCLREHGALGPGDTVRGKHKLKEVMRRYR